MLAARAVVYDVRASGEVTHAHLPGEPAALSDRENGEEEDGRGWEPKPACLKCIW